jgi:diadenosine tetraphosphatase ApaH/serine/threonine PP2A family protein phosphatase
MWAILSDIHSNLEAFQAVLADIDELSRPVERILCLGDTVGYGPNPLECLDLVRQRCDLVLLGNHDQAVLFDPEGFGASAARAVFWTREQLETPGPEAEERWAFLLRLPQKHVEGDLLYVHGSARGPLNEYVFPEDVWNHRKMERIFELVERCCFQGHTHVPGIFTEEPSGERYRFCSPEDADYEYRLDRRKTLINVGSVGQPRDGDWRACYVLLDEGVVRYRRVEYDVATTIRKIHDNPGLDDFLGDRLGDGR